MMKTKYRLIILILITGGIFTATFFMLNMQNGKENLSQQSEADQRMQASYERIEQIDFALLNKPLISPAVTNLIGTQDPDEIYHYKGEISFSLISDQSSTITLKSHLETCRKPLAMYAYKDDVFLLTQGNFSFDDQEFGWYTVNKNNKFAELNIDELDSSLLSLDITDKETRRLYWIWCLKEIMNVADSKSALECLEEQIIIDPHYVFDLSSEAGSELSDLLRTIAKSQNKEFYDLLYIILNSSRYDDSQLNIRLICVTLAWLDPIRAEMDLKEYKRKIKLEGIIPDNDNRLLALESDVFKESLERQLEKFEKDK